MLKDISSVELQGANFRTAQRLPLFAQNGTPAKASLVYGRNGSGKSTIAKAFRKIKGDTVPSIQSVSVFDIQNAPVTLNPDDRAHIFIFDEDYVNENVRVQEDGLGSIVMLGEQAGLADLIATATSELHDAETDRDQKKAVADVYTNIANDKSPGYYIAQMKSVLKKDRCWAERDKQIRGNAVNTSVSDSTYKDFIHLTPAKTRDELIVEYASGLEKLKNAQSGASRITATIPEIPDILGSFDVEMGNALLKKLIEHPDLSEREQYLLGLVHSGKGEELKSTAQEFESEELDRCPKCHQPLSAEYKTHLIASIQKVLSEEVKEHQRLVAEKVLLPLEMDLSAFRDLPHYQECTTAIEGINNVIQTNNALLKTKEDDPYTPVQEDLTDMTEAVAAVKTALQHLESDRIDHNRSVADTRPIKTALTKINNEIAYYDVIELSRKYDRQVIEKQTADNAYNAALSVVAQRQSHLNDLNARRNSIDIAIDVINDGLKYIFFSDDRMQIHVENGVYKLLSKGHAVKPKDVSVGERNIIGLCYFFTNILQGKNKAVAYGEEYLLVIDDPVSSYDLENKVGILSFLKYQLGKFLLGNIETRALLMTHDLLTAIDVQKMFSELIAACGPKFNGQRVFSFAPYELSECNISRFVNNRNEYTELMKLIYEYANGGANEQGAYIGNIMRQVMEAFATFEYKKGIDNVSTDDSILAAMEHEEDRIHYKNLMYRIVLNEGSHRYDQTRNMQMDFFAMISEPDRRRTAKEILCFMYLLNKPHMKAHLGDQNCGVIKTWCEATRGQNI